MPPAVLDAYQVDYGSADLEEEYLALYGQVQESLRRILLSSGKMAIISGEGMAALWGGLKSGIVAGDRVLAVATGLFGYGIGDMARTIGAQVETVGFEFDTVADAGRVEEAIARFRPKMVTMVHCETPSGTLNPVAQVGKLVRRYDVPLFCVDAVSSAAGAELRTDEWNIDLCLVGTQKCLSAPPSLAIVAVSDRSWPIIEQVGYEGYDALLPFRDALEKGVFPHTPYWHGMATLDAACRLVLEEGLEAVWERHKKVAAFCLDGIRELGLELYPKDERFSSPTVTAVKVPDSISWRELDRRLREQGVALGGNYGPLADRVFRIGHMGSQARESLVRHALDALGEVIGRV